MSMLNDSNPSVDALLAGFYRLSPEEQIVFQKKLTDKPPEENREEIDRIVQAIREGREIDPEDQKAVFENTRRRIAADRPDRNGKISLDEICGGWADDERSAEEIIREIYESRTFSRERPPL